MSSAASFWIYILYCSNHTYYTGYTTDLTARYQSHLDGTGRCKYTRSFKPVRIAQAWELKGTKAQAMEVERYIKRLNRVEKERLIAEPKELIKLFEGCRLG